MQHCDETSPEMDLPVKELSHIYKALINLEQSGWLRVGNIKELHEKLRDQITNSPQYWKLEEQGYFNKVVRKDIVISLEEGKYWFHARKAEQQRCLQRDFMVVSI
jgi:hypothetical protein